MTGAQLRRRIGWWLLISLLVLVATSLPLIQQRLERTSAEEFSRTNRLLAGEPLAGDFAKAPNLLAPSLRKMLGDGRAADVLTHLNDRPDRERSRVALLEIAASLETGDVQHAQSLWQHLPTASQTRPFGKRVGRGFDAIQTGVRAALFDRTGEPVAYRTEDGQILLGDGVDARLIPEPALAALPEIGGARISLDLRLSSRLLKEFQGRLLNRVQGGIVILDAKDASLLAAVSSEPAKGSVGHNFLHSSREPASIAKLLTTSAALRAGLDPDAEIRQKRCNGGLVLGGEPLYCSSIDGRLSGLDEAMATSCNIAFARLGTQLGAEAMLDEYRRFGFADYPSEQPELYGHILQPMPSAKELGELSIGLNVVELTPLHAAVMARTLVDGYLEPPKVLLASDGLLGLSPRPEDVALAQHNLLGSPVRVEYLGENLSDAGPVIEPEWLPVLHSAMIAVADPGGTANGVEPNGFNVAMKTGTASDRATGFHINYIGFAPAENPKFAFALRLTHARTSKRVRRQAVSMTRALLRVLAEYEEAPPVSQTQLTWNPGVPEHQPAG